MTLLSGYCLAPPGARPKHDDCRVPGCPCDCHPPPCPECRAGKHQNCDGQTWDNDRDEPGVCPCWVTHEKQKEG